MATNYPVNPRVRAYGKARIDIAQHIKDPSDWEILWKQPLHAFPFVWGQDWKQCVEYKVDDFAAEIGFFIDVLGLPVNAFYPGYAMFTSPGGDYYLGVVATPQGDISTPPDAVRVQFMLTDLLATTQELEKRGIVFEQLPQPCQPGSSLYIGYFRTPHGICIDLWGRVNPVLAQDNELILPASTPNIRGSDDGVAVDENSSNGDEGEDESDEDRDDDEFLEDAPGEEGEENGPGEEDEDELDDDEGEFGGNGNGNDLDEDEYEEENDLEADEDTDEELEEDVDVDEDEDEDVFYGDEDDDEDDDFGPDEDRLEVNGTNQSRDPSYLTSSLKSVRSTTESTAGPTRSEPAPRFFDFDVT